MAGPNITLVCIKVCAYLNNKEAYMGELVEHCECAVVTVNRATKRLRNAGAPLRHVRHSVDGTIEHYWRLDRKLTPGEAEAFAVFASLPEESAQRLLKAVQAAPETS